VYASYYYVRYFRKDKLRNDHSVRRFTPRVFVFVFDKINNYYFTRKGLIPVCIFTILNYV